MKNVTTYKDKKVLVLGLAKSGYETAKLLQKLGAEVTVNDGQSLAGNAHAVELSEQGIKIVDGGHPLELLTGTDLIVKNPGIPYKIDILKQAAEQHIPIITEVELAYRINEGWTMAVTGTNGKTTVTSLIGDMFKNSNKTGLLSGNIGYVASKVAQQTDADDYMITELSSFQLMGIQTYRPHIAVITNIYSAHLDYHGTQQEYVQAKMNIAKNQQSDDYLIFNLDQKELLSDDIKSDVIFFSTTEETNGSYIKDNKIYFQGEKIIGLAEVVLPGQHNLENVLASTAACKLAGISDDAITQTLRTFKGISHRLEFVADHAGIKYYNDSKATNTLAASFALAAFQQPIHWICGGLDRGNGFEDLDAHISRVKHMYIVGETTEKLRIFAQQHDIAYTICRDVKDAVTQTAAHSERGDVVLLSPACASWDQYKTFEVRGDEFIQQVGELCRQNN
ncbi:UDP-N-acetylmuramoyl-L-alanine--D-glutamate ligase [Macrococcus hajekii]|uniref:UDP-N-acetylmuramoylalanine--D-glutamate ligase n=1 Tax=Macrococcus hajekii TaxID=198482 RepID=A0A4R6BN53_9STAP|nr:UDP-N-acetylmuramoyl-L-alanine--D-glutamate ligase [Macrococcus hajekii]TDM03279.1 UDP-N-acetylmuramoyl-L-alanine--D-glutamate ligase [Macrococcus hajekii]GGA97552.1 UDP-N-acetylmuramoylalanine--D-glutamate ligase [Macrococcus hajekii]